MRIKTLPRISLFFCTECNTEMFIALSCIERRISPWELTQIRSQQQFEIFCGQLELMKWACNSSGDIRLLSEYI